MIEQQHKLKEIVRKLGLEDQCKSEILKNHIPSENRKEAVNIAINEVRAKQQKDNREKKLQDPPSEPKRKYIQNTVIHIEKEGASYILNGYGVLCVLRILLAFLLYNHLLENTLMFFVDGHSLYSAVIQFFSWNKNIIVILDWYHLRKRCQELLSMALKERAIRNTVLEKLMPLLWHGLVDEAIKYMHSF